MDAQPQIAAEYAIKSYRYLRLTIVVMVLSVIISVLLERLDGTCTLPSFSAYYYTPVHAVFIGALVAVGACLIAIKGTREWEDMSLNVAGMLAPIVAFVPTNRPDEGDACGSPLMVVEDFDGSPFVANNVTALVVSGVVVVGVAYAIATVRRPQAGRRSGALDRRPGEGRSGDRCRYPGGPVRVVPHESHDVPRERPRLHGDRHDRDDRRGGAGRTRSGPVRRPTASSTGSSRQSWQQRPWGC